MYSRACVFHCTVHGVYVCLVWIGIGLAHFARVRVCVCVFVDAKHFVWIAMYTQSLYMSDCAFGNCAVCTVLRVEHVYH